MCVCDDFSMLGVQLKHIKKPLQHPAVAAEKREKAASVDEG